MNYDIRTPWRAVAAMFALNGGLFGIWASRIPAVAQKLDISPGALGLLLLLLAAGAMVAFSLSGRATDRYGAATVCRRLSVAYTVALLLVAISPSFWFLGLALFAFGLGLGGMGVAMNAWAAEVERLSARPLMSSFHAMFSVGTGLGAASGFMAASFNLPVPVHFAIAGLSLAAIALCFASISWASDTAGSKPSSPAFSLPEGRLMIVGLVAFCATLGEGAMADWSALFLVLVAGVSDAQAALGYAVFSVAMIAMRIAGDSVVSRIGSIAAARLAGLTAAAGAACAVGFATFPTILFGFSLMGLGYAMVMPLAFSRAANDPTVAPGAAIAAVSTLGFGGIVIGPVLLGYVAEVTSIRMAFAILPVLALFIFVFARSLSKDESSTAVGLTCH